MYLILESVILLAVSSLYYAVDTYTSSLGSLEDDIVFDSPEETGISSADSIHVFLISAEIGPYLDPLKS